MRTVLFLVALAACNSDSRAPSTILGTLQIEVLDQADVQIEPASGDTMTLTLTSQASFGLLPAGQALRAEGFAERMPETGDTLYTAKLAAPAVTGGPCGDEPVSLALSLHRQTGNDAVLGGISAYCGADTWYGVPVRVLRLAGPLPLPR
jgi:hypothetical protein